MLTPIEYRDQLLEAGIKDNGCHHEFKDGLHGRKLDFGIVFSDRYSVLYQDGLELKAQAIANLSMSKEVGIVSVADGTITHTKDLVEVLNDDYSSTLHATALHTEKIEHDDMTELRLTPEAVSVLQAFEFREIYFNDDVGTSGSSLILPARYARKLGVTRIVGVYDWIRSPNLEYLDVADIPYVGIIEEPMANHKPDDCPLCRIGVPLIPHKRK